MCGECYKGADNLEALLDAVNYNRFLVDEIVKASRGAAIAVDFGAGMGTFATAVKRRGLRLSVLRRTQVS